MLHPPTPCNSTRASGCGWPVASPHGLVTFPTPRAAACTPASALGPKSGCTAVTLTGHGFKYRVAYARQG